MHLLLSLEELKIGSDPQKASLYVMGDKSSMRWPSLEVKTRNTYLAEFNMFILAVYILSNRNTVGHLVSLIYTSGFKCCVLGFGFLFNSP